MIRQLWQRFINGLFRRLSPAPTDQSSVSVPFFPDREPSIAYLTFEFDMIRMQLDFTLGPSRLELERRLAEISGEIDFRLRQQEAVNYSREMAFIARSCLSREEMIAIALSRFPA